MKCIIKYGVSIFIAFGVAILFLSKMMHKSNKKGISRKQQRKQRKQRRMANSALKTVNSAFKQINRAVNS